MTKSSKGRKNKLEGRSLAMSAIEHKGTLKVSIHRLHTPKGQ